MTTLLRIKNRDARRLWLDAQGLSANPTGKLDLPAIIRKLGFVQLDTIQIVSRAHHHILWSRNQNYREPMLNKHLAKERSVFEHFTHDASVLPMEYYPVWQRQMRRKERWIADTNWYKSMLDEKGRSEIKRRIAEEGALSTHAFDTKIEGEKQPWARPPHKLALDYMWYAGELATCHRKNFTKFYNLSERVIPQRFRQEQLDDNEQLGRLCSDAMKRLAFGSIGDIKRFWDASDIPEVKAWADRQQGALQLVEVEAQDGSLNTVLAADDIEDRLNALKTPSSRLRILNPFDPVIRDRNRLSRLFGFDYRIEIFVPAHKRRWGYYVYPLLEGDRFVGRIEIRADREKAELSVLEFWQEPGVKWPPARHDKLDAELVRLARLANCKHVIWRCTR